MSFERAFRPDFLACGTRKPLRGGKPPHSKITVAPTGARRSKKDHRALPISDEEIAIEALACESAGSSEIHLHVRDADGRHTIDPHRYRAAIAKIHARTTSLDIQVTTESAGVFDVADQLAMLTELRPQSASISIREMARDPAAAERAYRFALDTNMRVQHILYNVKDLTQLKRWRDSGIVTEAEPHILFVLGSYDQATHAMPEDLFEAYSAFSGDFSNWTACAFGLHEQEVMLEAAKLGGNVRIGFENNIFSPNGELAQSNAANICSFRSALAASSRLPESQTT